MTADPDRHGLEREQVIARPLGEVFEFFSRTENLERITPPWLRFRALMPEGTEMRADLVLRFRLRLHGVPLSWISVIEAWEPDRRFVDRQIRGPYRLWRHEHEFTPVDGGTRMRDSLEYSLPLGRLGEWGLPLVRRDLKQIFDYRQDAVARLLG